MTARYTVVLLAEGDGRYSASVPALPGTLSWGDAVEDALANITEAIEGMLAVLRDAGEEPPDEHSRTVVATVAVEFPEPVLAH